MNKNLLSNIFNSIKNEELSILKEEIASEKSTAVQNGQIDSSAYFFAKMNLAKNSTNSIYKKILQKLKNDRLNHFIKKDSDVFLKLLDELNYEVFEIITDEDTTYPEGFSTKTYRDSLIELKEQITNQWNNEAVIQGHIKKQEKLKQFKTQIISLIITVVGAIIAGVVVNQYILHTKPIKKAIKQEISSSIIEKIQQSPQANKEASYLYKVLKNLDGKQLRKFLKELYLKLREE